jgi:DNA-binding GntR family transcriptional regulator
MDQFKINPIRQRTLSDGVADQLRDAIRSGAIPAGARLVEQELAERFSVSRVPVREAIQSLVDQGLVRKKPHYGAFVYLPAQEEIEEISSLRVVLERFVIERVVAQWQPSHQTQLHQIVREMRAAAEAGDLVRMYELDYTYHYLLWEIAGHNIVLEIVAGLRSRINRFLYEAVTHLPPMEVAHHLDSHDHLIQIIAGGDVEAAQHEITRHVLGAKGRILLHCSFIAASAPNPVDPPAAVGTACE